MISLLNVTFFLLAEQCVKAYSYHGNELSKEDGSELWFWHVDAWLTLLKLAGTKACWFHQGRAECKFSSSFPNRMLQCSYHEPQKQRKWAASHAHRIESARPRQDSFCKAEKACPNSAQHGNPSETPKAQWGFSMQHPCPALKAPGSPLSTVGLVLVLSQQPWEAANTHRLPHTMRNTCYSQSSQARLLWLHIIARPGLPLPQPPQKALL